MGIRDKELQAKLLKEIGKLRRKIDRIAEEGVRRNLDDSACHMILNLQSYEEKG